mmetsp:Transcript_35832/g.84923  ORF Transcript_35832/g.84923 Transcript_35832/m.84923 type:complete len:434 (-) Transcript_35832:914-2215(-)
MPNIRGGIFNTAYFLQLSGQNTTFMPSFRDQITISILHSGQLHKSHPNLSGPKSSWEVLGGHHQAERVPSHCMVVAAEPTLRAPSIHVELRAKGLARAERVALRVSRDSLLGGMVEHAVGAIQAASRLEEELAGLLARPDWMADPDLKEGGMVEPARLPKLALPSALVERADGLRRAVREVDWRGRRLLGARALPELPPVVLGALVDMVAPASVVVPLGAVLLGVPAGRLALALRGSHNSPARLVPTAIFLLRIPLLKLVFASFVLFLFLIGLLLVHLLLVRLPLLKAAAVVLVLRVLLAVGVRRADGARRSRLIRQLHALLAHVAGLREAWRGVPRWRRLPRRRGRGRNGDAFVEVEGTPHRVLKPRWRHGRDHHRHRHGGARHGHCQRRQSCCILCHVLVSPGHPGRAVVRPGRGGRRIPRKRSVLGEGGA